MENTLVKLYNELGNKIVSMIPGQWEKIYYLGEVEGGRKSCSSVFYFIEQNAEEINRSHDIPTKYQVSDKIYRQLNIEACDILLKIYDCFVDNGQIPWEQLTMSIDKSGGFKVDFVYDIISKCDNSQMEREIIWAYDICGYMPQEGTYPRKVLERLLKARK